LSAYILQNIYKITGGAQSVKHDFQFSANWKFGIIYKFTDLRVTEKLLRNVFYGCNL
jgi:hypothetical protein